MELKNVSLRVRGQSNGTEKTIPNGYPRKTSLISGEAWFAFCMHGTAIPFLDMGGCSIKINDDGSFNMLVGATTSELEPIPYLVK